MDRRQQGLLLSLLGIAVLFGGAFLGSDAHSVAPLIGKGLLALTAGALVGFQLPEPSEHDRSELAAERRKAVRRLAMGPVVSFAVTSLLVSLAGHSGRYAVYAVIAAGVILLALDAARSRVFTRTLVEMTLFLSGVAFATGHNALAAVVTVMLLVVLGGTHVEAAPIADRVAARARTMLQDGAKHVAGWGSRGSTETDCESTDLDSLLDAGDGNSVASSEDLPAGTSPASTEEVALTGHRKMRIPLLTCIVAFASALGLGLGAAHIHSAHFPTSIAFVPSGSVAAIAAAVAFWQNAHRQHERWGRHIKVLKVLSVPYLAAVVVMLCLFFHGGLYALVFGPIVVWVYGWIQNTAPVGSAMSTLFDLGDSGNVPESQVQDDERRRLEDQARRRLVRVRFVALAAVVAIGLCVTAEFTWWLVRAMSGPHPLKDAEGAVLEFALAVLGVLTGGICTIENLTLIKTHLRGKKEEEEEDDKEGDDGPRLKAKPLRFGPWRVGPWRVRVWEPGLTNVGLFQIGVATLGASTIAAVLVFAAVLPVGGISAPAEQMLYMVVAALAPAAQLLNIAVNTATDGKGKIHLPGVALLAVGVAIVGTIVLALNYTHPNPRFPATFVFALSQGPAAAVAWLFDFLRLGRHRKHLRAELDELRTKGDDDDREREAERKLRNAERKLRTTRAARWFTFGVSVVSALCIGTAMVPLHEPGETAIAYLGVVVSMVTQFCYRPGSHLIARLTTEDVSPRWHRATIAALASGALLVAGIIYWGLAHLNGADGVSDPFVNQTGAVAVAVAYIPIAVVGNVLQFFLRREEAEIRGKGRLTDFNGMLALFWLAAVATLGFGVYYAISLWWFGYNGNQWVFFALDALQVALAMLVLMTRRAASEHRHHTPKKVANVVQSVLTGHMPEEVTSS